MKRINLFRKKTRAEPSINSYAALWMRGEEDILPSGYVSLSDNAEILRCVYKIADAVSNMTIMLMKNGENGDIRLKDNLAKKIDIEPCSLTTRKNFIFKIVTDMCVFGNSVIYPEIDRDGRLINLIPLNARACSFIKSPDGYEIRYSGKIYHPDEVVHFSLYPHPEYFWRGQGICPLLGDSIETLAQANATKKSFLRSKWKPSLVIAVNSDAAELQDSEMRQNILGSYRDETERGEPWLIPSGEIDIKTVQPLTLKDLAIQESITLDKQVIASAIGIPSFLVGIGEFNVEEYNNFINTIVMSYARIIEQELTKKLIYADDRYFKFNSKSLMQYSLIDKISFAKQMVGAGSMNRNEMRCEFDYSPIDNPAMNEYNVLENYIPVDRLGDQKKLKGGYDSEE